MLRFAQHDSSRIDHPIESPTWGMTTHPSDDYTMYRARSHRTGLAPCGSGAKRPADRVCRSSIPIWGTDVSSDRESEGKSDAQPSRSLVMASRSRVVHCGSRTRLERQWRRVVSDHNGDSLHWRLDTCRSGIGCIQSQPRTVGAHWSYTVARAPRRGCWRSPAKVTTWPGYYTESPF